MKKFEVTIIQVVTTETTRLISAKCKKDIQDGEVSCFDGTIIKSEEIDFDVTELVSVIEK